MSRVGTRVRELIAELGPVRVEEVEDWMDVREDVGLDDQDINELVMDLESEFGLNLREDVLHEAWGAYRVIRYVAVVEVANGDITVDEMWRKIYDVIGHPPRFPR